MAVLGLELCLRPWLSYKPWCAYHDIGGISGFLASLSAGQLQPQAEHPPPPSAHDRSNGMLPRHGAVRPFARHWSHKIILRCCLLPLLGFVLMILL